MALPAFKLNDEVLVEARIVRLEEKVDHVQSDVSDLKIEIRSIRSDMKEMDQRLTARIDDVKESVVAVRLQMKDSDAAAAKRETRLLWTLSAGMGTLLGIMAKGFGWV